MISVKRPRRLLQSRLERWPTLIAPQRSSRLGALLSYGTRLDDAYRQAANYICLIALGVKPADPPIEQPTKFELVLNLKTARSLGVSLSPAMLARANEAIEFRYMNMNGVPALPFIPGYVDRKLTPLATAFCAGVEWHGT